MVYCGTSAKPPFVLTRLEAGDGCLAGPVVVAGGVVRAPGPLSPGAGANPRLRCPYTTHYTILHYTVLYCTILDYTTILYYTAAPLPPRTVSSPSGAKRASRIYIYIYIIYIYDEFLSLSLYIYMYKHIYIYIYIYVYIN